MAESNGRTSKQNRNQLALLIAFHFPPIQGSSGLFRSLAFSRYLPDLGWDVCVLTAHPRAYTSKDQKNLELLPKNLRIIRASAFNAQKHFSLRKKYPTFLALPDVWQSWVVAGVIHGMWEIHRRRITAIVSTYPIASAHLIGLILHRFTKRPWIADFRDPMVQGEYPPDKAVKKAYKYIEELTFRYAKRIIVVSDGTKEFYRRKYPDYPESQIHVIQNGYDEHVFEAITSPTRRPGKLRTIKLLHSGLLYERERNPESLFVAIASLLEKHYFRSAKAEFIFRASGNEAKYQEAVRGYNLSSFVSLKAALPYKEALSEMLSADALIVCQGAVCDGQIPAKVYEYIFTQRPIIGLCNPRGDTGQLLRSIHCPYIAALEDAKAIEECLARVLEDIKCDRAWSPSSATVKQFSRKRGSEKLAEILNNLKPV
jgi:glycosyltransferase involved in cell wall biosynthesis